MFRLVGVHDGCRVGPWGCIDVVVTVYSFFLQEAIAKVRAGEARRAQWTTWSWEHWSCTDGSGTSSSATWLAVSAEAPAAAAEAPAAATAANRCHSTIH